MSDPVCLREDLVSLDEITLNVLSCGTPGKPVMLFLHGFPEYSGMWAGVMPQFADRYHCIAPDQRGYNLSYRPRGVDHYKTSRIVGDALKLIDLISPDQPITLVAHDWGASIAYALSMWKPDRVQELVVINGLHPACFQQAILDDPKQQQASQYFHFLRDPETDAKLLEAGCAQMFGLFAYFSDVSWMTDAHRLKYRQVWSQPGAMTAMLDWYRASPVWVPKPGESAEGRTNPFADKKKFWVEPRHLLIWGEQDPSCRPTCHQGLSEYCRNLTKVMVPDADHWIVGAKPDLIVNEIEKFLAPVTVESLETA